MNKLNLTKALGLRLFHKKETLFSRIKKYGFLGFLFMISGISIFSFIICLSVLKLNANVLGTANVDLNKKTIQMNELWEENQRMEQINRDSTVTDILDIASIFNEILLTTNTEKERLFFHNVLPYAVKLQIQKNIPISGILAQSIYESGYGSSELAKEHNNFFGLKNLNPNSKVKTVYMLTKDSGVIHKQPFRSFDNPYDGFMGYYEFLKESGRYSKAFKQKTGIDFISSLLQSGYCPDSNYLQMIQTIINRHKLFKLEDILKKVDNKKINLSNVN